MFGKWRSSLVRVIAVCLMLSCIDTFSQEYPTKAIRLVQPTDAGGLADTLSRVVAQRMAERLGQPMVVENRAGAMTMIGNDFVSRAAPDGYTILWGSIDMTIVPYLRKNASGFDATRSLTPVAMVASNGGAYAVHSNVPVNSLTELVAYAKANPGKVRAGSTGEGGSLHLTLKMLETRAGVQFNHIHYKGTAQCLLELLAGEIEFAALSISSAAQNKGKLKVLGQTGALRHTQLADVPTTAESGMPEVNLVFWWGLLAPPQTGGPIVQRLAQALDASLSDPAVRSRFTSVGADVAFMSPAEFTTRISADQRKWAELLPKWGFKPE